MNKSDDSDYQKRSPVFFPEKIGSAAPGEGPTHFSKQDPAWIKSGPVYSISDCDNVIACME